MPDNTLGDYVENVAAEIDGILITSGVEIPNRPMIAAHMFVEHYILDMQGDTKEDFLVKPWFKDIYQTLLKWYQKLYGNALDKKATNRHIEGACRFFGAPFTLKIPLTLSEVEIPGETAWLIFPIDLHSKDDPLSWIVDPPNFVAIHDEENRRIMNEVIRVGTSLRYINNELGCAKMPDSISRSLGENVRHHVEHAAQCLTEHGSKNLGLACWEAHQALEKSYKLYLRQIGTQPPRIHEISVLAQAAYDAGGLCSDVNEISNIPVKDVVIKLRASEESINIIDAFHIYDSTLNLLKNCCLAMKKTIRMNNAKILLKRLPFIE